MDNQTNSGMGGGSTPQGQPQMMNSVHNNTLMGILSYLGPLVIVSYLTSKDNPFVKFHIKQGLVLLVIEAAIWVLGMFMWQLWALLNLVNLATLVLSILGIVNVMQGNQKELPLVGSFAKNFKF